MSKGRRIPLTFLVGIAAFAAILVPILARRYWMVLVTAIIAFGLAAGLNWVEITSTPGAPPAPQLYLIPAARDAVVYLVFASVLFAIKRLVLSSTPK